MRESTVNIESLNIGSIVQGIDHENRAVIGEINGISRNEKGYNVSMTSYGNNNDFIRFTEINPVFVTDDFLTDNFDKEGKSDLWTAKIGEALNIEIARSYHKQCKGYVIDLFDNNLHTFCSIEFSQIHQLQNILHYFNVEYQLDVSSYTDKK